MTHHILQLTEDNLTEGGRKTYELDPKMLRPHSFKKPLREFFQASEVIFTTNSGEAHILKDAYPLRPGDTVKIAEGIQRRDYNEEAEALRQALAGKTGGIIKTHNSHGLCYEVQTHENETAYFDPDELTRLSSTQMEEAEQLLSWLEKHINIQTIEEQLATWTVTLPRHGKHLEIGDCGLRHAIRKAILDEKKSMPSEDRN